MPGGPKWCELLVIVYSTPFSTEIKVNKTDVVTVCLFRIVAIEQIILNPVTVAKDSRRCDFRKTTAHRNQQLQRTL